jgi:predicted RNase H-like nuclease
MPEDPLVDHAESVVQAEGIRVPVGLDGCKRGAWVAAMPGPRFEIITDLQPLLREAAAGSVRVVLDVPIGLAAAGRLCDTDARQRLGPRRSSVFTPPCRQALAATSQPEASRLNRAATGKGIGAQAFGILPRIAAVDLLMSPDLQASVHEGHPEVSFAVLAGRYLAFNKKCPDGENERLAILAAAGLRFDPAAERRRLGCSWMERDDLVDAAAMLLTAMRIERGVAVRLPESGQYRDDRGLLMEMWA